LRSSSSIIINEKEEYELNNILSFRTIERRKKPQYKVI
jgi:hypothetical protein